MEPAPILTTVVIRKRGFTLVEMMVVLGIISIITSLALVGQSSFNKSLLLTDTAYTVALSARQAQSFGLSSRKFGSVQNPGFGLHFDRYSLSKYTMFADTSNTLPYPLICPVGTLGDPDYKPGNCLFDTGGSNPDGIVQNYTFSRGFKIKEFCGRIGSGGNSLRYCSTGALQSLDMVFTRPNTSSTITGTDFQSTYPFTCADITLTDATGAATTSIEISQLGEISVGKKCQ